MGCPDKNTAKKINRTILKSKPLLVIIIHHGNNTNNDSINMALESNNQLFRI